MTENEILELAKNIASELAEKTKFCTKEVLNTEEICAYMGISKSKLYQLTSAREIPHYKVGRICYFNRQEIEEWLQDNKILTHQEISEKAQAYCMGRGAGM